MKKLSIQEVVAEQQDFAVAVAQEFKQVTETTTATVKAAVNASQEVTAASIKAVEATTNDKVGSLKSTLSSSITELASATEARDNKTNERIDQIKTVAEGGLNGVLDIEGQDGDLVEIFNKQADAQKLQRQQGQFLVNVTSDNGTIAYNQGGEDKKATVGEGDSFVVTLDGNYNVVNASYSENHLNDRIAAVEEKMYVSTENTLTEIFHANLKNG
jgi:hypothetical protein